MRISLFKTRDIQKPGKKLTGRHRVIIEELITEQRKSVDIGCKKAKLGDISIDIDKEVNPNIVADVKSLPLKDETFERVFFSVKQ